MINRFVEKFVKRVETHFALKKWSRFIDASQYWSLEQIESYQLSRLKDLVFHAFENVPYYKGLFRSIGFHPNDLSTLSVLNQLPFLTKDILKERGEEFFPKNISKKHAFFYTTGGSTGEPLGFYRQPINEIIERAFMLNQWKRVGYQENSKRVILRGEPVKNNQLSLKIYKNTWLFSSYHLSNNFILDYVDELNRIKPDFFHVYPSSFYILTQLIAENGLKLEFLPKAILCGSENLHDYQRELFEKSFTTRAFSWLGLAEQTILACECEYSNDLHIWPQHSFVELIDSSGHRVEKIGDIGEIVGTNLHNLVTPFIRYKSGDVATNGGVGCSKCGREFALLKSIIGRDQHKLLLKDGRQVPLTAITFGLHFDAFKKIKQMQIIQFGVGEIKIYIDKLQSFNDDDESEIKNKISNAVNGMIEVSFEYTANFIRSNSGKLVYFIQKVKE